MFWIRQIVMVSTLLPLTVMAADKLPKADRVPAPPTSQQFARIKEGVALHDQRDYKGAIAIYKEVLAENPWEVFALHELALSYFANQNYDDALATARLGAQCRSENLAGFYTMMGNALDELGRGKEAVEIYKAAIKQNPLGGLLHYNLAISLRRTGKLAEAKAEVEKALQCDPRHASSHLTLADIYSTMGYRVPAMLAYSRFLTLEPDSQRARNALPNLQGLLTGGVRKSADTNVININISAPDKRHSDEGDFSPAEMMIGIVVAGNLMKPGAAKVKPESPYDRLVHLYSLLGEALKNSKPKGGFAATYYVPYFVALTEADHTGAFVAHAWSAGAVEGAAEWSKDNAAKLEAFRTWSDGFVWQVK